MILVIFGAGASFDSVPTRPPVRGLASLPRLPLAAELFSDRAVVADALSRFPDCLPVVPYLQSVAVGDTIEHTLEILRNEAETDPVRKQQMENVSRRNMARQEVRHRWFSTSSSDRNNRGKP